jgi:hypothetical protein
MFSFSIFAYLGALFYKLLLYQFSNQICRIKKVCILPYDKDDDLIYCVLQSIEGLGFQPMFSSKSSLTFCVIPLTLQQERIFLNRISYTGMYQIKEANQMIEEFMLAANISVAEKILKHYPLCGLLR